MDLRCSSSTVAGCHVVVLDGIADLSTAPRLQSCLRRSVTERAGRQLVVDLDALSVLDDVALGLLLGAAARARETGGELMLVCTQPRLRERLRVTRVDEVIAVGSAIASTTRN